ncbi:MarR family transcriptional regulator [Bacillus carboniphilus]|uniref:HTH-type transcriptional regulator SarZ n=1 Tax=Bacillus carboniphilus TaxID=86663 RepID=A0ABY9K380_9BACI|nr:MarR family transcriptional regulator [Bacillus carboniphilus]WLR44240.1 MarR family transcriptional regulator [Bacillus carboniphilus]
MDKKPFFLKDHLCFSIYACSREIIKRYHPLLKELNITYPQYLVLVVLSEKNKLTVKELGEELYLDSGTLTPLLKRLEQSGIVTRIRSKEDERKVEVSLTEKGVELKKKAENIPIHIFDETDLTDEDIADLNRQFHHILKKLNQKA